MGLELKTPFKDLLPPLSSEEFKALEQSILDRGIDNPILIDEENNILDGHHRYSIEPKAPTKLLAGLSLAEKQAVVIERNWTRRNLSPDQKKELRRKQKKIAIELKKGGKTQEEIGRLLGVTQGLISQWFGENISIINTNNAYIPDIRIKVNAKQKPLIVERIDSGETQAQVAADYGITQPRIAQIVKQEKKVSEEKANREEAAKTRKGNMGIECLDFREANIPDNSIDMIFTDPPYNKGAVSLYGDIVIMAARVLVPGGWLLAYSGHVHLPQVMKAFSEIKGLEYAWTFATLHSGSNTRFRKYKIRVGWKPIIAAFKPPLSVYWDWFVDIISGKKEKNLHEWQQSINDAKYFINQLCPEAGLVLDPCCGSGTSLLAAKNLNRKWIGYEIDKDTVEIARNRLNDKT